MPESRARKFGVNVLAGVLALLFFTTGVSKLLGVPPSPENFARWGLSTNFMHLAGALEVAGAIGLLIKKLSPLAAACLILVLIGAIRTGLVFHEMMHVALPAVLIPLLAVLIYLRLVATRRPVQL